MASSRSVPLDTGSMLSNSRTIYNACGLPFFGGMYFSILLLKKITPTLSLLLTALKAITAAISVIRSFFLLPTVPNKLLVLISTKSIRVNSLSSSNTLEKGVENRALTFQSIKRTSSPALYSFTSRKLIPLPLNAEWYSPVNRCVVIFLLFISSSRTFFNISEVDCKWVVR